MRIAEIDDAAKSTHMDYPKITTLRPFLKSNGELTLNLSYISSFKKSYRKEYEISLVFLASRRKAKGFSTRDWQFLSNIEADVFARISGQAAKEG